MRIVFMGSAELSCPSLEGLVSADDVDVVGVVTQPDRPRGRQLKARPGPVKTVASSHGIPVLTPEHVNTQESLDAIRACSPDFIVVIAYGQILSRALLDIPKTDCVNVHTSLLPRYRGAAPIQWAIANGETETGVTTMRVVEALDAGDILLQETAAIGSEQTAGMLHDRLAVMGATLLLRTLVGLLDGSVVPRAQDSDLATYAPRLSKDDGRIDWTLSADEIYNRIRGFHPWPGCTAFVPGQSGPVKIHGAKMEKTAGKPGEVLEASEEGILVAAGSDSIRFVEVQPAGGRRMACAAYLLGHRVVPGMMLQ